MQAYFDCRRAKRSSESALRFEIDLEHNLATLYDDLCADVYTPGRSICFVVTHPRPREVWAADFRDRIVHHLLYNHIAPAIHARFIADSCACIPGRGTLYGARRLEAMIRSQTQNWSRPGFYLKCDIANFFVSISKPILSELLAHHIAVAHYLVDIGAGAGRRRRQRGGHRGGQHQGREADSQRAQERAQERAAQESAGKVD